VNEGKLNRKKSGGRGRGGSGYTLYLLGGVKKRENINRHIEREGHRTWFREND